MAKKKVHRENKKEDLGNTNFVVEIKNVIRVSISVLVIFALFYGLTIYLTSRKEKVDTKKTVGEAIIQYEEILVGSSFSMKDKNYIVVYYDKSNDELKSDITNLISVYGDKDDHLSIYTVDMSNAFNKSFVSDSSNTEPESVADLRISGPTLIEFNDNIVSSYIEGVESISNYLE